ncbi:MAG: GNAT family N-acetyltransferase [Planctomycetota bacterium]|nr:GNAT family N-acetyltransferase [Planctomycetota bacterium]
MSHRRSFAETPRLLPAVFDLLETIWPGIKAGAGEAEQLGLDWGAASTPFVVIEGDAVISHLGTMEVPLVIDGEEQMVAAVHAVATHPEHRRKGHYRACIEEALAWIDERYALTMLTTDHVALYEPFGFRCVTEHLWSGPMPDIAPARVGERRLLDKGNPEDVRLLHRLLRDRVAISPRLGVVRELHGFAFYAASVPLWYLPALDAVLWYTATDEALVLHDLVAASTPAVEAILEHLPERPPALSIEFTADVVAPSLETTPHNLDGNDWLMLRGPLAVEGQPFMLPRTARF